MGGVGNQMLGARKSKSKTRPDRLEYLGLLVNEFQEVKSRDARRQVLANLANFAYDPYNYNYFRQLEVVDLFLIHLSDVDETVVQFAIGGLCNLSLDPKNKDFILKNDGIKRIMKLFQYKNENILISTLTTLMFLITPESKEEITSLDFIKCVIKLMRENNNVRIKNLAQVFLEDYCSKENIKSVQDLVEEIPLPILDNASQVSV